MEKILAGIFGTNVFATTGIRRKLMNKQGLKNTSTNTAIEILKTYPEFRFYHEYIEKRLAGDFAFDLVNLLLKNRKENEQLTEQIEKMKNCLNCKNYRIGCNLCVSQDGWELKEARE